MPILSPTLEQMVPSTIKVFLNMMLMETRYKKFRTILLTRTILKNTIAMAILAIGSISIPIEANQNRTDSIVFEYNTKPFVAFYKSYLAEIYGKPQKNLVKKRTYYNALTKVAYQTWEYNYETDNMGLVTKETWNIYTLPNNVLERTESTYFTYLKP